MAHVIIKNCLDLFPIFLLQPSEPFNYNGINLSLSFTSVELIPTSNYATWPSPNKYPTCVPGDIYRVENKNIINSSRSQIVATLKTLKLILIALATISAGTVYNLQIFTILDQNNVLPVCSFVFVFCCVTSHCFSITYICQVFSWHPHRERRTIISYQTNFS